jgi:hypothetical protein
MPSPSEIQSLRNEVARLRGKQADIGKKRSKLVADIANYQRSMSSKKDLRQISDLMSKIAKAGDELGKLDKAEADIVKQIQYKEKSADEKFARLEKDRLAANDLALRERRRETDRQERLHRDIQARTSIVAAASSTRSSIVAPEPMVDYDFFISHAWEDKEEVAGPLAETLRSLDFKVWYDGFELRVGDSLRRKIDHGISRSRFGIVVLSSTFLKKTGWTAKEMDGLVAKEIAGEGRILPIWHRVTLTEIRAYSPSLADKVALNTTNLTVEEIAAELATLARPT